MSFFADIIADSRRKIVSEYRSDHISGSMPVQSNTANPSNSSGFNLAQDSATGSIESDSKATKHTNPETGLSVTSVRPQTSPTQISVPSVPRTAETEDAILQGPVVPSTSVIKPDTGASRMNVPVTPVHLKVTRNTKNTQAYSVSPKVADPVKSNVSAGHNEQSSDMPAPEVVQSVTKQTDPTLGKSVENRKMRTKASLSEQYKPQQDGIAQAPFGMTSEGAENGTAISEQSRRINDQQDVEAAAVSSVATVQVGSTFVHAGQVSMPEVNAGHMKDTVSQQSHVQIGQVNVVIEQVAAPRRRASAVTGNADYASRNFLKSL